MNKGFSENISLKAGIELLNGGTVKTGEAVRFSIAATGFGRIDQLIWDFGVASPSTDKYPVITYQKPGVYNVRSVVWDEAGRAKLDELKLTVIDSVVVDQ